MSITFRSIRIAILLTASLAPMIALAEAPVVGSVDSDGATFIIATVSPRVIKITFNIDVSEPTIKVESDSQTVGDCGDVDAKTFCFDFAIPTSTLATKHITVSGAQNGGDTMSDDTGHLFNVDTVAPNVLGLSDDPTSASSKEWSWLADDPSPVFRFLVDTNPIGVPGGAYGSATSTSDSSSNGTIYLHVQAKDTAGNEGAVITVFATLDNPPPAPPPSGGGGGGILSGPLSVGFQNTAPASGLVLGTSTAATNASSSITATGMEETFGASAYHFTKKLQRGNQGSAVFALHKILINLGYLHISAPTGYFGALTLNAVKTYQAAHNLETVGIVGPLTRAALNKEQ